MARRLRLLCFWANLSLCVLPAWSQTSSSRQDVPVVQAPPETATPSAQPGATPSAPEDTSAPKGKGSAVKRKLGEALPDCVSIIFSKCWTPEARQRKAEQHEAERRAQAAERCKAIDAARAQRTPPSRTVAASGESSSKTPGASPAICSPEDVLQAEHDVDVGDFYLQDGNKRAAEMRYRDALNALPEDPVASLRLARLLDKQGRTAEAVEFYRTFLSWSPTGKEAAEAQDALARLETKPE